jgi:T5SS/PEP-CTERM-associated repeat protein
MKLIDVFFRRYVLILLLGLVVPFVGDRGATLAAVTATGDYSPNPVVDGDQLYIGSTGYGTFRIDEGTTFESDFIVLGENPPGFGVATVTDPGSKWTFFGGAIGQQGYGRLEVLNGGVVEIPFANILQFGGFSSGASGSAVVEGEGSVLQVHAPLRIGTGGTGAMRIADGAIVNVPDNETLIGGRGRLELDGGLLRTSRLNSSGVISGSGEIDVFDCCGQAGYGGRIEVGAGDRLRIMHDSNSEVGNFGEISVEGGELEFGNELVNENQGPSVGQILLRDGILRAGQFSENSFNPRFRNHGLVATVGGVNHVHGSVRNDFNGDIAVTNNSLLMFHHDVEAYNDSTISVFAGSTAIFLQDLNLNGGTLLADLTGAAGFGHVEVVGDVFLNGQLQINLSNGYTPQLGDSFPLVTAAGEISGLLSLSEMPTLPEGLDWRLQVGANQVVLAVVALGLAGDYNGNGVVDAADYTTWRDMFGQTGTALAADGSGPSFGTPDGVVDYFDYDFWKTNFGNTMSNGAGAANIAPGESPGANYAVPEPSSLLLFVAALALIGFRAVSRR